MMRERERGRKRDKERAADRQVDWKDRKYMIGIDKILYDSMLGRI